MQIKILRHLVILIDDGDVEDDSATTNDDSAKVNLIMFQQGAWLASTHAWWSMARIWDEDDGDGGDGGDDSGDGGGDGDAEEKIWGKVDL